MLSWTSDLYLMLPSTAVYEDAPAGWYIKDDLAKQEHLLYAVLGHISPESRIIGASFISLCSP